MTLIRLDALFHSNGNMLVNCTNYSTLPRESESIAYFTAPDISETTVMLFGLEVIDDDKTASYGSTSITIEPVQGIPAVGTCSDPTYNNDEIGCIGASGIWTRGPDWIN